MEDINKVKSEIRNNIKLLIEKGNIDFAKDLLNEYENIVPNDIDIYSTKAVIAMIERNFEETERILNEGLEIDSSNVDLNYNLGYLYEQQGQIHKALEYYKNAKNYSNDINLRNEIDNIMSKIEGKELKDRKKIVFFSKGDDKFIWDIINELSKEYETKKITVTKTEELKLIDKWMDWADICWFEWCDELVAYGSRLEIARNKKIICRLHSYEAFTNHINNVQWENVDRVLFVAEHIRSFVLEQIKNIEKSKTIVIPNGININKYKFIKRKPGFNIAYVGYINYKKGPMLLLHMFKKLYDKDNRYKLYIAGKYQDWRYLLYFKQMIKEMGLENNVFYDGWQDNIDEWLEDKNYIVSTSVLESQHLSIMEAMAKGIKPIIHNFVGAKDIYSHKYIWNTVDEAIEMVLSNEYDSEEFREYIENNYLLEKEIDKIKKLIKKLLNPNAYLDEFNKKYKTDFSKQQGYYMKSIEEILFFMSPWNFFDDIKSNCSEELVFQQLQNQFKYISEMYFNGIDMINQYSFYYLYLLKLLQTKYFIDSLQVQELLQKVKRKNKLDLELIEETLLTLYTILKNYINKIPEKEYKKFTISDVYKNKKINNEHRLVKKTYDKLYESFAQISKYIKSFFIHGSLSTLDYTSYSDVDTQVILKNEVFCSISTMRYCKETIKKSTLHLFEYDPLQHHRFFIITEMDLDYYPQSYLPVELLNYSTLVHGEKNLNINLRSSFIENLYSVWNMAYGIRASFIEKKYPKDLFSLKRYTSRLMLLPTLYLELFYDIYPYKRDSFEMSKKYFSNEAWKSIEIATSIREKWNLRTNLEINEKFFYYAFLFAEECINKIFNSNILNRYNKYISGSGK